MDYFTDVLATFLDLDPVTYIAVCGRARELTGCLKKVWKIYAKYKIQYFWKKKNIFL